MSRPVSVVVVSDIHHAGEAERARGHPREALPANLPQRLLMRAWDQLFWMRDPLAHNHLLDRFLETAPEADWVVGNGDFACNGCGLGVSDDAVLASARQSLGRLRERFGARLLATIGDHELGKTGFVGGTGGMRLASWPRVVEELAIQPFWQRVSGATRCWAWRRRWSAGRCFMATRSRRSCRVGRRCARRIWKRFARPSSNCPRPGA
jgi:hypothetical protein